MVVVCQILLNKPKTGVYRAGDDVTGVVKYAIDDTTEYEDILLTFKGESYCSLPETNSVDTGQEEHVCQKVSLLGASCTKTLPSGVYTHEFKFTLPKKIPPSFKTTTGHVTYRIVLDFNRKGIFKFNKSFNAKIPVLNYLNPTLPDTAIVYGVNKIVTKPLTFRRQKITLKAQIANPYLKPGDTAQLKFMVTNDSSVRVKGITAELVSKTSYTAADGRKSVQRDRIKNCCVETDEVPPRSKGNFTVEVPTLPEHRSVQYSNVIEHQYQILTTIKMTWPYWNARTAMPVLIGEKGDEVGKYTATKWGFGGGQPPSSCEDSEDMDECKNSIKTKRK